MERHAARMVRHRRAVAAASIAMALGSLQGVLIPIAAAIAEAPRTSGAAAVTFVALSVSARYAALLLSPFAVYS